MILWPKTMRRKDPIGERTGYTKEEIDMARENEPEGYTTACQRIFYSKLENGSPIVLSTKDPDMSKLDLMVIPHVIIGSLIGGTMGITEGGIACDESCPGFTPIPIEPFTLPNGDVVRCQRFIPGELLSKGWDTFRNYTVNFDGGE